jgi:hypothetical protein
MEDLGVGDRRGGGDDRDAAPRLDLSRYRRLIPSSAKPVGEAVARDFGRDVAAVASRFSHGPTAINVFRFWVNNSI